MTAKEARIISDKNRTTPADLNLRIISRIEEEIRINAGEGSDSLFVFADEITEFAKQHFKNLGYAIELDVSSITIPDNPNCIIKW